MAIPWRWLGCMVAAGLVGCSERPTPPLALQFEPGGAPEEVETLLSAARAWNERIGSELFYVATSEQEVGCDRVQVRFVDEMPAAYDDMVGLFQQVGCHYEVSILRDAALDHGNAAHELGHTLGLGHSDDRESVMYWSTRSHARIKDADVMAVHLRWGL